MSKVYIVTSGSYSDYRIEAVFSTREKAEGYYSKLKQSDDNDIEVWPLDDMVDAEMRKVFTSFIRQHDGAIANEGELQFEQFVGPRWSAPPTHWSLINRQDPLECYAYARSAVSQEHARKIAIEYRQAWLREQGNK